jgi:hypothetical protein
VASIAVKASLYQIVMTLDNEKHYTLLIYPLALCQLFQILTLYMIEYYQNYAFSKEYRNIQVQKNFNILLDEGIPNTMMIVISQRKV